MGSLSIHSKFDSASCPASLPMWDDGVDSTPSVVPLSDLIKKAAPYADIVMFGDTDHFDPTLRGSIAKDENLQAIKEAGFTHIALEVPKTMQHWVSKLNDGELSQKEFEEKINLPLFVAQGNEKGEWTRTIGKIAQFSKENDIQLVFADPKNGEGVCDPNTLDQKGIDQCEEDLERSRFQDDQLSADHSARVANDPKAKIFQAYGAAHYSVDNGSKEALSGRVIKIDVFQNRADYELDKSENMKPESHAEKMGWGGVKPDLIYMLKSQDAYTTCSTPSSLKEDIHEMPTDKRPTIETQQPVRPAMQL
ncbi:MAG: hypothetical protein KDJ26_07175 [Alphaproteobacteria bacterium]|nr:hypothetical protein [Alphaproteobacteria bacterium]MCB9984300.1 hypothetical protein [Micavibrio sp.]HRK97144.1 hypothetical protein [Alphaproteobacteria bacterium]